MRARALALALPAAALLAAGCGGSGSGSADADPAAALPAGAPVYISLSVGPDSGPREDFADLLDEALPEGVDAGARIQKALDQALAESGEDMTYEDDIEPWLGNRVGASITSLAGDGEYTLAFAAKDTDKAKDALDGQGGRKRSYQGVDYRVDENGAAAGVTGDFLIAASDEAAFKRAVDAEKGSSLADSDAFRDAVDPVGEDHLGLIFLDAAKLGAALTELPGVGARELAPLRQVIGRGEGTAVITADAEDDALVLEATGAAPGAGRQAPDISGLPGGAWLAFGAAGIGDAIDDQLAGRDGRILDRELKRATGLTLGQMVGWVGDLKAYVSGSGIGDLGVGVEISSEDARASTAAISRLAALIEREAAGSADVEVERSDSGVSAEITSRGLPGRIAIEAEDLGVGITYGAPPAGGRKLGGSDRFRKAAERLEGRRPSFYFDPAPVLGLVGQFAGNDPDYREAKPYLDSIDYVIAGSRRDGDRASGRFVVGVK